MSVEVNVREAIGAVLVGSSDTGIVRVRNWLARSDAEYLQLVTTAPTDTYPRGFTHGWVVECRGWTDKAGTGAAVARRIRYTLTAMLQFEEETQSNPAITSQERFLAMLENVAGRFQAENPLLSGVFHEFIQMPSDIVVASWSEKHVHVAACRLDALMEVC